MSVPPGSIAPSQLPDQHRPLTRPNIPHARLQERQYETTVPTVRDRVAQMALKMVLEPIFEADFYPHSYGYRPGRRAQDAIAEIHKLTTQGYEWVVEGDITACFDNVDHQVLMGLVEQRITDRKVLRLVRGFLRAGVVEAHGGFVARLTGTPQGGVMTPPTQSRTWCGLLVGVTVCGRGGGGGASVGGDGVADEDAFGADEDVLDQQP